MSRRLPRLCVHTGTKQYYIRIQGKQIYLGSTQGDQAEARAEAERLRILTELERTGQATKISPIDAPTVNVLLVRYLQHCQQRYRKADGTPTSEYDSVVHALKPLQRLYGGMRGIDFGPLELQKVVEAMATGSWMNETEKAKARRPNWCRNLVNQNLGRTKRLFRWAVSQAMLPVMIYQTLVTVSGLRRGQTVGDRGQRVRETDAIPPAPETAITRVKADVRPVISTMIDLQLLTGMRPGEVCALRPGDIDQTGEALTALLGDQIDLAGVWAYLPPHHKTAHHGNHRIIPIGPQAQALLASWLLGLRPTEYLFSPKRERERQFEAARAARKSKVQPSQYCRAKIKPKRIPGKSYTTIAYAHAVRASCVRQGLKPWHPNQLRHNAATRLVKLYGWDVTRIILGHSTLNTTRIYAADDLKKAFECMKAFG